MELLGLVVQSLIKLGQDIKTFKLCNEDFCILLGLLSLRENNLKIHKTKAVKNTCIQEKFITNLLLVYNRHEPEIQSKTSTLPIGHRSSTMTEL